jgi:hypothetical protein
LLTRTKVAAYTQQHDHTHRADHRAKRFPGEDTVLIVVKRIGGNVVWFAGSVYRQSIPGHSL